MIDRLSRIGIDHYCVSGSWGAEFIPALQPESGETVVVKHGYSGFSDTKMNEVLSDGDIRTVVLCGTATNNCVDGTGRDAFFRGYFVVLAPEAACAPSIALHEHAVETARHAYAVIAGVDEIESVWGTPHE
jgi:ureidoacrylate peracid hydrolase